MRIHCQRQICSPRSVVSGDIKLMPIFVGVRCWSWGGVKWECGRRRRKCEFSLSITISSVWSSPLALHVEIYTASRGFLAIALAWLLTDKRLAFTEVTYNIINYSLSTYSLLNAIPTLVLSNGCDRRKCENSLSIAIYLPYEVSHWFYIPKFYTASRGFPATAHLLSQQAITIATSHSQFQCSMQVLYNTWNDSIRLD